MGERGLLPRPQALIAEHLAERGEQPVAVGVRKAGTLGARQVGHGGANRSWGSRGRVPSSLAASAGQDEGGNRGAARTRLERSPRPLMLGP
jgi:hypothetical protein